VKIAFSGVIRRKTPRNWSAESGNGTRHGARDGKNTSGSYGKVNFPAARVMEHVPGYDINYD
jgi:hypothetical protein